MLPPYTAELWFQFTWPGSGVCGTPPVTDTEGKGSPADRMSPIVGSVATPFAHPAPVVLTAPRQSTKPLGFVLNPTDGLFVSCCDRKIHQPGVTYIMFAPPRITVLPLPPMS